MIARVVIQLLRVGASAVVTVACLLWQMDVYPYLHPRQCVIPTKIVPVAALVGFLFWVAVGWLLE